MQVLQYSLTITCYCQASTRAPEGTLIFAPVLTRKHPYKLSVRVVNQHRSRAGQSVYQNNLPPCYPSLCFCLFPFKRRALYALQNNTQDILCDFFRTLIKPRYGRIYASQIDTHVYYQSEFSNLYWLFFRHRYVQRPVQSYDSPLRCYLLIPPFSAQ
jgi:hypothetical protein